MKDELHITLYPRFGACQLLGPQDVISMEAGSADTSEPTNRIAAAPDGRLSR